MLLSFLDVTRVKGRTHNPTSLGIHYAKDVESFKVGRYVRTA